MMEVKLNSTGSLKFVNGVYYSYKQQMTANYKGYMLFDSGYYSMTTRKHQAIIKKITHKSELLNAIDLYYADFNSGIEYSINNEIMNLEYIKEQLSSKRKTKKNLETISKCDSKIVRLQKLLEE